MKPTENKKVTVKSAAADSRKKTFEEKTFNELAKTLEETLFSSVRREFTKETVRDAAVIVLKAASEQSSVHAARKKMTRGKSRRQAVKPIESITLNAVLDEVNKRLRKQASKHFRNQEITVSVDVHDTPYHGRHFENENEVRGGKQKDGTRHFHGFATAYANVEGKRFTLAVTFVPNHSTPKGVVGELLRLVNRAGIQVNLLLLDKWFFSVDVFRLLKRWNTPFVMPLKGSRLQKKRGGYKTFYVVKSVANGVTREERVTAYSVVKYDAGKRFKKHGARNLQYVAWRVNLAPSKVAELYRKRFGIESSYKSSKKTRARTSSRNPAYRAFLLSTSFFIQNAWVEVKQLFCLHTPKWSARFVTLHDFAGVLLAVIRESYGEVTSFVRPS